MFPYNLLKSEKSGQLLDKLNELTACHLYACPPYKKMVEKSGMKTKAETLEEVPFLPVQLFKMHELRSVPLDQVVKVLTSSGTTGQQVSKIYLNKETAVSQTRALVDVMRPLTGNQRMPMVIIDTKSVLRNRKSFSARGAGILGFSNFGRKHFYALNDDYTVDWDGLEAYIERYNDSPILFFGFTFIIWKHFYEEAVKHGKFLNVKNGLLIHGGGWKKLYNESVSADVFNKRLKEQFGISNVHNYYGMVEQVGSIFLECSEGFLHTPNFADIIVRDAVSFHVLPFGRQGLIQVLSELPESYPGHSLLTEDLGTIYGEDDCLCGWKGKYFTVSGRIPKAEVRGCSDTFSAEAKGESV